MTKPIYTFQRILGVLLLTVTARDITQSDDIVWHCAQPTLVRIEIHEGQRRIYQTVIGMARSWDASTAQEAAGYAVQHMWGKSQLEEVQ
jgi:hypothetical protein